MSWKMDLRRIRSNKRNGKGKTYGMLGETSASRGSALNDHSKVTERKVRDSMN